jgi:hypothetical protein
MRGDNNTDRRRRHVDHEHCVMASHNSDHEHARELEHGDHEDHDAKQEQQEPSSKGLIWRRVRRAW